MQKVWLLLHCDAKSTKRQKLNDTNCYFKWWLGSRIDLSSPGVPKPGVGVIIRWGRKEVMR